MKCVKGRYKYTKTDRFSLCPRADGSLKICTSLFHHAYLARIIHLFENDDIFWFGPSTIPYTVSSPRKFWHVGESPFTLFPVILALYDCLVGIVRGFETSVAAAICVFTLLEYETL